MSETKTSPTENGARAESRYISCTIDNNSTAYWTVKESNLSMGKWLDDNTPNNILVDSNNVNFVASGRANTPSGCEGYIIWQSDSYAAELKMSFECPYGFRASTFDVTITGEGAGMYNVTQKDFDSDKKGHDPIVTITSMG